MYKYISNSCIIAAIMKYNIKYFNIIYITDKQLDVITWYIQKKLKECKSDIILVNYIDSYYFEDSGNKIMLKEERIKMIYLIRHGLDNEDYIGGWSDIDLIETGLKQVEKTRDYIVQKKLLINNIISSDIKRAKTTSRIINEKLKVDITLDKDLRELDKGIYTG